MAHRVHLEKRRYPTLMFLIKHPYPCRSKGSLTVSINEVIQTNVNIAHEWWWPKVQIHVNQGYCKIEDWVSTKTYFKITSSRETIGSVCQMRGFDFCCLLPMLVSLVADSNGLSFFIGEIEQSIEVKVNS